MIMRLKATALERASPRARGLKGGAGVVQMLDGIGFVTSISHWRLALFLCHESSVRRENSQPSLLKV